jgi:trigger factor
MSEGCRAEALQCKAKADWLPFEILNEGKKRIMTHVEETVKKGLKREFKIKVPQKDVQKNFDIRLTQLGQSVKLPGFRLGKVPMAVLKQRFGANARGEVLDQTVSQASRKALQERNLRPATEPQIELISFGENEDLEFKLAIEILPEIAPTDFSKIELERVTSDVADKTIEDAIQRIAKSIREPELVTEKRGAKMGDILVIDFDGSIDGEPRPGMKGDHHRLELGSKSFIDNFEEQLVGSKTGDKKTITVTFPDDYNAAELAGKKAEFKVEVKELRAPKLAELNDDLAKELGLASLADLKKRVGDDIKADYDRISRAIIKRHLLDELAALHDFELPAGMVEAEFDAIWKQVEESKKRGVLPAEEAKKSDEQLKKDYRAIAERRIRLGLLLAEVSQRAKVEVSSVELRNAMVAEARRFPGQEKAVVDYYTQNQGALERLRAPILEEKVIDHILFKAKVSERKVPPEELIKMPEEME